MGPLHVHVNSEMSSSMDYRKGKEEETEAHPAVTFRQNPSLGL